MSIKTMEDLFVATLKDIYYAEKQILKALPGMVKKASGRELREALETHRKETEGQVDRLDRVFKLIDVPARGKKCEAIEGIIDEAKEHMQEIDNEAVLDAGIMRLRPVMITVLALVIALVPLAMHGGPLWEPMCYVQIAGMLVATLVTLVLVPVLYVIFVEDLHLVRWQTETPKSDTEPSSLELEPHG
jgi:uncharacterized membrane protein